MFVVSLIYKVPLGEIDRLADAHKAWLKTCYAEGLFLVSGAKRPRTGGVIIAQGARDVLDSRLAEDPFARAGAADYEVTEFAANSVAPCLEAYRES
jgi:uncharacterized protein YciI